MDIIVTGVSGGMGLATAKQLIRDGHRIFGLDIKAPEEQYESLLFFQTDLRNEDAVKAAFQSIQEKTDQIGAIIHLAGIYDLNSLVEMSEKGSRILITTSELAPLSPLPFTGIYGITKTALDAYAISLRRELMLLGIPVIIIRPGAVDTGLLDVSTRRLEDFCEHTEHYSYNADRFRKIVAKVESRKITPERLSELVEKALFASHPRLIYTINRNPLLLLMNILPAGLQDAALKWILLK